MDDGPKREFFFCSVDYVNKSCKTGVNIDTIANLNKDFCFQTFHPTIAKGLHMTFLYFFGHIYLLYVILHYFAVTWPMKHGNWHIFDDEKEDKLCKKEEEPENFMKKLPKKLAALRSDATLFLIACLVFLHINSWPTSWKLPFNWAFTLRPQINLKPSMTMKAQRSKSEILSAEKDEKTGPAMASCRSKSCGALTEQKSSSGQEEPTTSMDSSLEFRLQDEITDKYWNSLEKLIGTLSLASQLSRSDFLKNSLKTDSTNQSVASSFDFEFDQKDLDAIDIGTFDDVTDAGLDETYLTGPGFNEVNDYVVEFPPDSDDDETFSFSKIPIVEITPDDEIVEEPKSGKKFKSAGFKKNKSKRETFA